MESVSFPSLAGVVKLLNERYLFLSLYRYIISSLNLLFGRSHDLSVY